MVRFIAHIGLSGLNRTGTRQKLGKLQRTNLIVELSNPVSNYLFVITPWCLSKHFPTPQLIDAAIVRVSIKYASKLSGYAYAIYLATKFTSLPGTTITFLISFPSR